MWKIQEASETPDSNFEEALAHLDSEDFLAPRSLNQPALRLAHPSLREAYEKSLPPSLLKGAHQSWVQFLRGQGSEKPQPRMESVWMGDLAWAAGDLNLAKIWGPAAAEFLLQQSKAPRAVEWYRRLLSIAEDDAERCLYFANLAPLYYLLGKFDEARKAYDRWHELRGDDGTNIRDLKYLFYIGLVRHTAGEEEKLKRFGKDVWKQGMWNPRSSWVKSNNVWARSIKTPCGFAMPPGIFKNASLIFKRPRISKRRRSPMPRSPCSIKTKAKPWRVLLK